MRQFLYLTIVLCTLGFASCKDSEGSIDDPYITDNGQDHDSDEITGDNYVYHLPVIFHVFYTDSKDTLRYIPVIRFKELLDHVNELYAGNVYNLPLDTLASENLHVQFELAEKDENGKRLGTPGVEYIKTTEKEFVCEKFMKDKNFAQYTWDQNDYINVMVYAFKQENKNTTVLGISHLPYQVGGYPQIDGLSPGKNYPLNKPQIFPYCVSLNALFVNKKYEGTRYTTDKGKKNYTYNTADPNATLAHELGHYLGLFHAFSETKDKDGQSVAADNDDDTDYCTDTPSYNRIEYAKWLDEYMEKAETIKKDTVFTVQDLAKRSNSSGKEWLADNLMDYSICLSMRFTPEQANRMRQVLYYSPLIPGPKKKRPTTTTKAWTADEDPDLPIVYAKERAIKVKDIRNIRVVNKK